MQIGSQDLLPAAEMPINFCPGGALAVANGGCHHP
jgi:hypothetical protein